MRYGTKSVSETYDIIGTATCSIHTCHHARERARARERERERETQREAETEGDIERQTPFSSENPPANARLQSAT